MQEQGRGVQRRLRPQPRHFFFKKFIIKKYFIRGSALLPLHRLMNFFFQRHSAGSPMNIIFFKDFYIIYMYIKSVINLESWYGKTSVRSLDYCFSNESCHHLTFIVRNIPWTPMSHVSYVRPCMYVRSNVSVRAFCFVKRMSLTKGPGYGAIQVHFIIIMQFKGYSVFIK